MMTRLLILLKGVFLPFLLWSQHEIALYDGPIPGAKPCDTKEQVIQSKGRMSIATVVDPSLTAYLPQTSSSRVAAVIICPGGGYSRLAATHEGHDVAKRFQSLGIAAFVLKYRLPNDVCMEDKSIGPLQDAQQGIAMVRKNAEAWGIDPHKIGIMGFSAGGHLASTVATHFASPVIQHSPGISVRPDFAMLIYPVISMNDSLTHSGSKVNLIGKDASPNMVEKFSSERQVGHDTPPAFLVHAADDKAVVAGNSIAFSQAMIKHNRPVELHIFPSGGHGFGMDNRTTAEDWFEMGILWIRANGWML